jgi:hypothetical protein
MKVNEKPAHWTEILDDLFGVALSKAKAERWRAYIKSKVYQLQPGEVSRALMWAKENKDFAFEYKPTVDRVVMVVRWYRKEQMGGYSDSEHEGAGSYLRKIYMRACQQPTPLLAWNMLISPECYGFARKLTTDEVTTLVTEYEKRHPDFERPYAELIAANGDVRDAFMQAASAMPSKEAWAP